MTEDLLLYKVALSMIPGIGGVLARTLVEHVGSVEAVFREPLRNLIRIPGIGEVNGRKIRESDTLVSAEKELAYAVREGIRIFFYLDGDYPRRFRECADAPVVCYYKGVADLDMAKAVSVVGTRHATDYGRQICDELLRDLASRGHQLLVVSGLAYGIDIQAHKSALKYGLPTVGVLGHGLDKLYPAQHAPTAKTMLLKGGLLTDFPSGTRIDPPNFIRRNRLIAGLSDVTVVVESGEKGGALITSDIASSYDREVCAFPGRAVDIHSKGCNMLIKKNIAAMIENAEDLEFALGWIPEAKMRAPRQQELFARLSGEEQRVVDWLKKEDKMDLDTLAMAVEMPVRKLSALLLELEVKGGVVALPGNQYRLKY